MIKLEHVNKYFNRHKKNQIHVINDTSLELSSSGLVALLGPSGCGKTTILNAIGGLDKVNSGSIFVNGEKITRVGINKKDKIRNLNVGYIFQDYKLVETMTVFENVALSLRILGLKDKSEIQKRVMYTLEKVNMSRYKNRPASMLSGGEKQRVCIARALVKNPKIIIADEPTGNLDSKNSLEIMKIIKSISNKYLVVLVTHEEELASFFADRIVELKDGKIVNDYKNDHVKDLNYEIDNQIYLKDYENINNLKKDNINIEVYDNNETDLRIKIVLKNGNIYIKSESNEKIEVIDANSNIELVNDHFKKIKKEDIEEKAFDIESISNDHKPRYSSIFKLLSFVSYGFKKLLNYSILKKILLIGFVLSGMFIYYSISSIFATLDIQDKNFVTINKDYLTLKSKSIKVNDYLEFENNKDITYILPSDSIVYLRFYFDKYMQTNEAYSEIKGSLSSVENLEKEDLMMGRIPESEYEIVLEKLVIDSFIDLPLTKNAGYQNYDDFLNHDVIINNMKPLKIVGITNSESEPNIYANSKLFTNIVANAYEEEKGPKTKDEFVDYDLLINDNIKIVKGKSPVNDYEVVVHKDLQYEYPINKKINIKVNGQKLLVVGFYENRDYEDRKSLLVNNNTLKYALVENTSIISIFGKNKNDILSYFRDKKMNIYDSYDYSKTNYIDARREEISRTISLSIVIIAISFIEIYLMIRASFLSRIKEVGIFRAIGIKKIDIYKMFMGEILAITTIASVSGIILMYYILTVITKIPYLDNMFKNNIITLVISFIIVYLFNIIIGLLPVYRTIRKTPAEILSRNDVD